MKEIADKKAKITTDTYGDKNSLRSLDVFFSAVEKGDYELTKRSIFDAGERQGRVEAW